MKGFEVVTGMKIAEWAADLAANREVLRQGQEGSMTFTLSGRVRAVQKRGVWEADTWSKTIKLVGDWLWWMVVGRGSASRAFNLHPFLLGSDFACQSWEERMVTLRSHDTWGIGHWLGEGEPFWFQDSSCLGWNFRNSHRLQPRLQSRHISSRGQWVIDKILRSWGKLKQLLIQQLYELIKAAIPINLLAALKYLPFQPGDWETGWESLGETLGPLGHWYPQVWDGDYALLSHVA